MEKSKGIGGRKCIPVRYIDVNYNAVPYVVGEITTSDGRTLNFVIDAEDKKKAQARSWHSAVNNSYVSSTYSAVDGSRKSLYLHNFIMNRLDFDGKGAPITVDHISGNGLDNRKKNLRLCTQSEQNRNTSKRIRKTEKLPKDIRPDEMPTNVWYAPANGYHGDRFIVEIKGITGMEDIVWKTTSSKAVSTRDKLASAIAKRNELIHSNSALYDYVREAEISQALRNEFQEIIELANSRIEHID